HGGHMMRSWFSKNAKTIVTASAVVSVVVHVVVITGWVVGTLPEPSLPPTSISNHIFYIPAPDRVPTQPGSREAIRYVKVESPGLGSGEGPRMMGETRPTAVADETIGKDTK